MAELIFKISDQGRTDLHYRNGDVVCAYRCIQCAHAQHMGAHEFQASAASGPRGAFGQSLQGA